MSDPVFSVVIPAFNRSGTIEECVKSVQQQTLNNFEIIIVDDGSSDNTKDVVEKLCESDSRITYVYQDNGGGSKARNTGIKIAKGKYIAFLDSDDVFLSHHLEQALPVLESKENVCTYAQVVVDRGDGLTFLKPGREIRQDEHISEYLMCDRGFVPTITFIVPRELALRSLYDEEIKSGQDYDFAIKIVSNGGLLTMLPSASAIWNDGWDPGRLSSKPNPDLRTGWLNRIKPLLTDKAYWAETGWPVARAYSQQGRRLKGLSLYSKALFRGCYKPKMAIVIFLQVLLSKSAYRKMSDVLAKFGIKP
ncbi:glycosyltransferase family 2 protein [Bowmanella yangjiangensis]|uniref:Glycosyltransferase family 2 protein n=1 Tax=Bowmanella yangjiangensis TaxID=2811230 RepID=A0ABS3CSY4_9ALTE|nr:glycosyltransferase family 2 protein [Bowmanella yangjiangensis]